MALINVRKQLTVRMDHQPITVTAHVQQGLIMICTFPVCVMRYIWWVVEFNKDFVLTLWKVRFYDEHTLSFTSLILRMTLEI